MFLPGTSRSVDRKVKVVNQSIPLYNESQQREEFLMGYPQIILLAFFVVQVMYTMFNDGKKYTIDPMWFTASFLFTLSLLILGGFFDVWGIAQFVYVPLATVTWGTGFVKSGQKVVFNFYGTVITAACLLMFYWAGGFFS
jgi:hypothetical protein